MRRWLLLKEEQGEDDGKKAYCTKSFGQTDDEAKVLAYQVSGHIVFSAYSFDKSWVKTIEVEKVACPERVSERIVEQVDVPVPVVGQEQVFVDGHWVTVWRRCRVHQEVDRERHVWAALRHQTLKRM